MKIKKNDEVIVISGNFKGKVTKVTKVFPSSEKVLLEGVNVVKKHQKPGGQKAGGIIDKTLPIHISNVALVENKKPSKVGYKLNDENKKVRYFKKSTKVID